MTIERPRLSPADLKRIVEAERAQAAFLVSYHPDQPVELLALDGRELITVGRRSSSDLALVSDPLVSRTHARLERIGEDWLVFDSGVSRNGSFVNGRRLGGHQLLVDGDQMRFGSTVVEFRYPRQSESVVTHVSALALAQQQVTPMQRRVLVALCRPIRAAGGQYGIPASNPQIAREVFLGVDAVKAHLRELYRRFGIDLPQNQKRARLAEQALQLGLADES